jgi:hypothetical protein
LSYKPPHSPHDALIFAINLTTQDCLRRETALGTIRYAATQHKNFGAGRGQFERDGALDTSRRPGAQSDRIAQAQFYWPRIARSLIA